MRAVRVTGVPSWVEARRLLGSGFAREGDGWAAALDEDVAADVLARLRGVSIGGSPIVVDVAPPLGRTSVREGRTRDARARRDTTPGFTRPGVRLDDEGRWSLTPEDLALWMGRAAKGRDVVDWGCGVGGNTIGFARAGSRVVAVERDAGRLEMARHNARIYGVTSKIEFRRADTPPDGDLWFVDPPWGTDWDRDRTVADAFPLLVDALARLTAGRCREVWAKLPPSFDPSTVPDAVPTAVFGHRLGDAHRVKFVWLRIGGAAPLTGR